MARKKERVVMIGDYFVTPTQFEDMQDIFDWLVTKVDRGADPESRWKMDLLADILYVIDFSQRIKE